MKNRKLLFLCDDNSAWSRMAEGFAREYAPSGVEVFSAGTCPDGNVDPLAVSVMAKYNIDISESAPASVSSMNMLEFDLVIVFSDETVVSHEHFRGLPAIVNWNIIGAAVPGLSGNTKEVFFAQTAKKIKQLVGDLFSSGYFSAFSQKKINTDNMFNSLSEGMLAHDLERKIFYFSDKAVELTGLSKESVLGKDCHEIFTGGICGENCSFCNTFSTDDFTPVTYPVSFVNENGQKKECDLSVVPLKDDKDKVFGVAASFKDKSELNLLKMRNKELQSFSGIIGRDETMLDVFQQIKDVADYDFPVHVYGETGTGKELVAAAIHNESARKNKPFVPVNCGALPESLIESELFGHVRGAFSGAVKDKKGRFELAEGGTIFLDEIGELSKDLQVKLLRFLQEGTFEKVGGEKTIQANVRVISATNRELKKEAAQGNFREDLYYRLNVIPVNLPALKEKINDIPLLIEHFCEKIAKMSNKNLPEFSGQAISVMMTYNWPGNVRELENAVQYAVVRSRGEVIESKHLPMEFAGKAKVYDIQRENGVKESSGKLSIESVKMALKETGGNKSKAAKLLGVGRATLYRFLDVNKDLA